MKPPTVGEEIGPLVKAAITKRQLVEYAGASGDFNPIHYDDPFARAGGFPQVIAHGMLTMAFFGQLLSDWAGPDRVVELRARFKAVTFPDDVVTVRGRVTACDGEAAAVELTATKKDGTVTLEGSARVKL